MKALKIWSVFVLAVAIALYLIGIFSGEFSKFNGLLFWGHSLTAILLIVGSVFCLLLFISLIMVIKAIKSFCKN
jgi:hypothetical protein